MDKIKKEVQAQFTQTASSYVENPIHAKGSDLPRLIVAAQLTGRERVLDVGTATGHTAFAFAPYVKEVVGVDLTPAMLEIAREQAAKKKLNNVIFQEADVENLPFEDATFDRVTCRICAHHFPRLEHAVAEMHRVLKTDGMLLVVDNVVPEQQELDEWINTIERLRDRSHVRAYKRSEWRSVLQNSGFTVETIYEFTTPINVERWMEQAETPPESRQRVRDLLATASAAAVEVFEVKPKEGVFHLVLHKAVFLGKK